MIYVWIAIGVVLYVAFAALLGIALKSMRHQYEARCPWCDAELNAEADGVCARARPCESPREGSLTDGGVSPVHDSRKYLAEKSGATVSRQLTRRAGKGIST